ncbi:MAG: alpha-glucan family phosphorylase [Candidatus Cloacimonetes bacterium]|nr:alpha-glucan family phosphorylase [Candidatus Cloacimonadota bacterium]MCF7812991.1 alpha-glucan family phosphorylase [Candidatus Cloacimonadota bacterium]MCF7867277.1 alpha-glucan family phosphorylase [Candidatus Cloacimonadota bacterium]MCF7882721.1 alpha-glucan family phosphorylase [Candidatus Cloacimonadota bacterium]
MKDNIKFKNFYVNPQVPKDMEPLLKLARNLWSTWDPDAFRLFNRIDPVLFRKFDHNPLKVLQDVPNEKLEELSQNSGFMNEMNSVYEKFETFQQYEGFFLDENGEKKKFDPEFKIAYFSMEFGIHESLPVYSGGLGVLSGDHLKAASDLGIPLTAFGLLYRYGYFNQRIDLEGKQQEVYTENEWYNKPIQKLKDKDGKDLLLSINLRDEKVYLKVYNAFVGKVPLYLLDTDLEQNKPQFRAITDHLYVADRTMRMLQEIVLAFGSLELIKALELQPNVYHLNEGHSAFLIIKRLQNLITENKFSFDEAMNLIKGSTVFTTHTPVPAGNEEFDSQLVKLYLEKEVTSCGISFERFSEYAKMPGNNNFNLSALAIRFSKFVNGVSKIHSEVAREMWHPIYPNLYEDEFPFSAITNGVHVQSWISRQMARLFDRYLGTDYQHRADDENTWKNIHTIPNVEIWHAHQERKEQLISFVRRRLLHTLVYRGASAIRVGSVLNPNHLLVGFARRFASYKRGSLILHNKERLLKLLSNEERPIQFIYAGKAHPADEKGKAVIKSLIDFAKDIGMEHRFVFLENYDINIARHLVQGVDVWLNNPIKPHEASGTSGMKAGMNGALNLSVPDGWWPECYNEGNGWSITSGDNIFDPSVRDTLEANEIYDILENEITKIYYDQDRNGLPKNWIKMMKNSIQDVGSQFNMQRVLRDYLNKSYLPSYHNNLQLSENEFVNLKKLQKTQDMIKQYWNKIKFQKVEMNIYPDEHVESGLDLNVKVELFIDSASEDLIKVEAFYMENETDWQVIPLDFTGKEKDIAHYELKTNIIGAGKQSINVRIRPKPCFFQQFEDYIKWYY